jgi:hypothetical protein
VSAKASDAKLKTLQGLASELLDELAEDAQEYLDLLARLREAEINTEEHGDIEAQLYAKVVGLKIHSAGVQEALDVVTEALPEDE